VWDYADLFAQPQGEDRRWRVTVRDPQGRPVDLLGSPFHILGAELPAPARPPALGEHTESVLAVLLGLGASEIATLRQEGVI
jgi:crotonobetainyl-CoA:carnitine CoA-transferase CaiB-like acyl-CoA transferase